MFAVSRCRRYTMLHQRLFRLGHPADSYSIFVWDTFCVQITKESLLAMINLIKVIHEKEILQCDAIYLYCLFFNLFFLT